MTDLYEALYFVLEDALERQEKVLAACQAQGKAARARDVEYLEAKTLELVDLMKEAARADKTRADVVKQIALEHGLQKPPENLTQVTAIAPGPWRERLNDLQTRLQAALKETRAVVHASAGVMRAVLRVVGESLQALEECCTANAQGYEANGLEPAREHAGPKILDRKG